MKLKRALEHGVILGAYPLLAVTVTGFQAVAGIAVVLVAAVLAGIVQLWLRHFMPGAVVWLAAVAASAAGAIATAVLLPYGLPIPGISTHMLAIAGVTPIVFVTCRALTRSTSYQTQESGGASDSPPAAESYPGAIPTLVAFTATMIVAGIIREFLGDGSVFLTALTPGGAVPAGIMGKPTGGFLLLALVLLGLKVADKRNARRIGPDSAASTTRAHGGTQ